MADELGLGVMNCLHLRKHLPRYKTSFPFVIDDLVINVQIAGLRVATLSPGAVGVYGKFFGPGIIGERTAKAYVYSSTTLFTENTPAKKIAGRSFPGLNAGRFWN